MGSDEVDFVDDGDNNTNGFKSNVISSNVSCSICLEPVNDNGDRSWAKLQCAHQFHLDCIGSAFNIKGAMQCPNCRKIEKGQWHFGSGCRSFPDISFEDLPHDEDFFDMGYSEMSFGLQWCPITAFPQLHSSFEEGEFPSTAYHDLLGQRGVFAEHSAMSSSTHHPCPYVAYYGPIHSSSSNSSGGVTDTSNYNNHWGSPSGSSEMPSSYAFAALDPHYHSWEHHTLPFLATGSRLGGSDQPSVPSVNQRSSRVNSDLPRSGSFVHPFLVNHSSSTRVGSPVTSSMIPPYPGSAARVRDRVQALQAYFQPPSTSLPMRQPMMSGTRRSSGHRSLSQVGPSPSSLDQSGGFFVFPSGASNRSFPEADNPVSSRFHAWERNHLVNFPLNQVERDSGWGGFHHSAGGSSGFRQRHGSDRPSQNRS